MTVTDIVITKLSNITLPREQINAYVDEIAQSIMTYCNRNDIPNELKFVHANMVIDLITQDQRKISESDNLFAKTIKEGDVQITFESNRISTSEVATQSIIFNYTAQLNKFRKLRW